DTFVKPPPARGTLEGEAIPRDGVLDLTAKLSADGRLNWDVPPGDWIILRLGHTPTGVENHPAPLEGTGLECDKFSTTALDAHWAAFVQKLVDAAGPLVGRTFTSTLIDSYEVGGQDWSENFRAEFQKRRGYDPLPFLPTFTGRVVGSPEITERFLWDMRRTIADLFADNYYGHFQELCHKAGLKSAIEPYSGPFESLQCGAPADVVMGEFWSGSQGDASVKLAASVAHIYGKQIVGAESFTAGPEQGRWQNDPWSLKTLGDLMYCTGLNRYTFHRYAMQPWTNRWPGMTMGQWGFHFERTITWWEQGRAWLDYIARCQFLLQQGRYVADAAYFCGENTPVEMRPNHPALPPGYEFDAINADVLLHLAQMKDGRLILPSGASYSVLVLPPDDDIITPPLLQRIHDFVLDGLTVVGPPPASHSPSLQDYPNCDEQVKSLTAELWGSGDGKLHHAGKGTVMWNSPMTDVFSNLNLQPDFAFTGESSGTMLVYCHRIADNADIYFVSNQRRQFDTADCTFRADGKLPELWHADTGVIEPAPIWSRQDGLTTVRIQFDPAGSVFVIFRQPAADADHVIAASASIPSPSIAAQKLEINHAVYEAVSGGGSMDVTARLAELVAGGQTDILADNNLTGRDPAPNVVKQLRVTYTLDGKPFEVTVAENEMLTLPAAVGHTPAPTWQVVDEGGRPFVKTSSNGSFELHTAAGKVLKVSADNVPAPVEASGPWDLKFPPNWGAPAEVKLDRLISWTEHPDSGVRYFSGTAVYEKDIEIPAEYFQSGREIWLDLGGVKNFAEVSLNGEPLATLWKPPFCVELTHAAHAGGNTLRVKVTNLWPNRLIGDEQLPDDREWSGKALKAWPQWLLDGKPSPTGRFTFTTWHHWTSQDAPLASGLLGPVRLEAVAKLAPN
ncbi:MAG TPA: glycosyl hydrolase, partial [Verrucomicrobiae bacterium]|nr:glycosyl hydrolase [Verrucomicrobiae bacterium]